MGRLDGWAGLSGLDDQVANVSLEGVSVAEVHAGEDIVPAVVQLADLEDGCVVDLEDAVVVDQPDVLPFFRYDPDAQADGPEVAVIHRRVENPVLEDQAQDPFRGVQGDEIVILQAVRHERIEIEGQVEIVPVELGTQVLVQIAGAERSVDAVAIDGPVLLEDEGGLVPVRDRRHATVVSRVAEDIPRLVERFLEEGITGPVFQSVDGEGGDVLGLFGQMPGLLRGILFEIDLIADVLCVGFVVGGGIPAEGNPFGGGFDHGQRPVFDGRSLGVARRLGDLDEEVEVAGIPEEIARFVLGYDEDAVRRVGLQPLEGVGSGAFRLIVQLLGFFLVVSLANPSLVEDVLRRR